MIPSLLITFREVLEASLIVATIVGLLVKMDQKKMLSVVWYAVIASTICSIFILSIASFGGYAIHQMYTGMTEQLVEGTLMIISAVFITWAVFFLHAQFSSHKVQFLHKISHAIKGVDASGLFILVFSAVFREGIEIVLFLSTIFFSDKPLQIAIGFGIGSAIALVISGLLFTATLKLPVYYAFRSTSALLILFGAGMLARGIHELAEAHIVPELINIPMWIVPHHPFAADLVKIIFGITPHMDLLQIIFYCMYVSILAWWVFFRKHHVPADPL